MNTDKNQAKATEDARAVVDLDRLDMGQIRDECEFAAERVGAIAKQMLDHLAELQHEHAVKSVLAGIYLQQVKAVVGHGQFGAWKEKHCGSATARMPNYYMKLAAVFAAKSRLLIPEIVAANQLSLALEQPGNANGARVLEKVRKFVGTQSLSDLLAKHAIKVRGGAQPNNENAAEPAASDEVTIPADWHWINDAQRAHFATLPEQARLAWIDWLPRLRAMHNDLHAGAQATHPHLDEATRADLLLTLDELRAALKPARR